PPEPELLPNEAGDASPMTTAGSDSRATHWSGAFVRWTRRRGRLLWTGAVLLALPAAVATARLYVRLNSEVEQLRPADAPRVVAMGELRARIPGLQYLGVVVEAPSARDLPAAEHLVDDLAARIAAYPPRLVRAVRTGAEEEQRFLERHAALYVELADLQAIHTRIVERMGWEVARRLG